MSVKRPLARKRARPSTGDALWKNAQWMAEAGSKAHSKVQRWLETNDAAACLRDIGYAIRGRTKDRDAILEKVDRKRKGGPGEPAKPNYEPNSLTDIYGFRIVTLFQRDMVEIVRNMMQIVNHDVGETPFIKKDVKEVRIFTNRPDHDPLTWTEQIAQVVEEFGHIDKVPKDESGKPRIPEHSATGYSSVHLILFTKVDIQTTDLVKEPGPYPLEVQIRSVFEDAWGEIDHKLRYEEKRRKLDQHQLKHARRWYLHLNALKTYVDGCTQYADLIRGQAADIEAVGNSLPLNLTPLETIQDALGSLTDLPLNIHKAVRQAYASREPVEAASRPEHKLELASKMIAEFKKLELDQQVFLSSKSALADRLLYYVKMEQAYAYLVKAGSETERGKRNSARKSAVRVYREVLDRFPKYVAVHYRLGGALLDLGDYKEASGVLAEGLNLLPSISSLDRLRSQLPRVLAYAFWRESENVRPRQVREQRRLIHKALGLAQTALAAAAPGSQQEAQARNSLVYYCYDYLRLAKKKPRRSKYLYLLREHLAEMELRIDVNSSIDLSKLDTLRRVYQFLDERDRMLTVARRIIAVGEAMGEKRLDDVQRENLALARRSVRNYDRIMPQRKRGRARGRRPSSKR